MSGHEQFFPVNPCGQALNVNAELLSVLDDAVLLELEAWLLAPASTKGIDTSCNTIKQVITFSFGIFI